MTVCVLTRFFILELSSLYAASCFFHSSTLAVLSCKAVVNLALLFFRVCSSTSHFLALAELRGVAQVCIIDLEHSSFYNT